MKAREVLPRRSSRAIVCVPGGICIETAVGTDVVVALGVALLNAIVAKKQ
jgi:hypothetical protein